MDTTESPVRLEGSRTWQMAAADEAENASKKALSELSGQSDRKPDSTVSSPAIPELSLDNGPDADDHKDVGDPLHWEKDKREKARPKEGEGYYETMKSFGEELLGRELSVEEVSALSSAAKAVQKMRGKDPEQLTTHDELLPKNIDELEVFVNSLGKGKGGPLSERNIDALRRDLLEKFKEQLDPGKRELDYTLRPVKDQAVVTKVVPDAVYIDSSHIQGGQGYRRKLDCNSETQDYWLSKPTAEALMRAQQWLQENGKNPISLRNMNGAGRRALDRELISKCAPNQPHATRHSNHEDGISIDVDNYDDPDVRKALDREGFDHNVPGDRPHFTRFGKRR